MTKKSARTAGNDYTIVLVPGGNGQITRIHIPYMRLRRMLIGAAVFVALVTISFGYSLYTVASLPERWQAEEQLLAQRLHLAALSDKLQQAERTMERVRRLDGKLRVVLGEGSDLRERSPLGIGGPSAEDLQRFDAVLDPESRFELARLDVRMEELDMHARRQEEGLQDLQALLTGQRSRLDSTPSIWPTRGWVTSTFGHRSSPFTGQRRLHAGLDIAARTGNPVVASADGVVLFAGVRSGYGKVVFLDHGYGVTTRYGHLSKIEVAAGKVIRRGELLGLVGSTGRSTGPHLHYEVHVDGVPVNPYRYILLDDDPLH